MNFLNRRETNNTAHEDISVFPSGLEQLQQYRTQTMKDYGIMIEYKNLKQHVPTGVYLLPSFDDSRTFYGAVFVRRGLYRGGIFKFKLLLPQEYNDEGTYPRLLFSTRVFHPYVSPQTGELDLKTKFTQWDSGLHYMLSVLDYAKKIFYMNDFPPDMTKCVNQRALNLFRKNKEEYVLSIENCAQDSIERMYENDPNSSLRFTKPIPAHESLKKKTYESKPAPYFTIQNRESSKDSKPENSTQETETLVETPQK